MDSVMEAIVYHNLKIFENSFNNFPLGFMRILHKLGAQPNCTGDVVSRVCLIFKIANTIRDSINQRRITCNIELDSGGKECVKVGKSPL